MTQRDRARARVLTPLLLVSGAMWLLLGFNPGGLLPAELCGATGSGASFASYRQALRVNPPLSLTAGWGVMLGAMMLPTLFAPILHVVASSLSRRRLRSVLLFALGYAAPWMAAGAGLLAVQLTLSVYVPPSWLPAVAVGVLAFVWQCSPFKQRCLNRGHRHRELAAFGPAADWSALRFGLVHGVWCVGSCWLLMLCTLLPPQGHVGAMAAVTLLTISERLDPPRPPGWRLRGPGRLLRIAIARARLRLAPGWPGSGSSPSAV